MNNKPYTRMIALLLTVILATGLLAGCQGKPVQITDKLCKYVSAGEDITTQVLDSNGDTVLLEDGKLRLAMDGNGVLKVLNRENAVLWSTGIASPDILSGINESGVASSSSVLHYQLGAQTDQYMDSCTGSFKKEQFRLYKNKDKIIFEQILGDFTRDMFLPEALTEARFAELLAKMDEMDGDFLKRQYTLYTPDTAGEIAEGTLFKRIPELKIKPFYVLIDADSKVKQERIHDIFTSAGYTSEDLAKDRAAGGINTTDQGTVFKVVIAFSLVKGELVVEIPTDQLYYPASMPLVNIQLFKYGIYAPFNSNGYYMLPSGAGALFGFGEGKAANYTLQYYGEDYAGMTIKEDVDYTGHPVYGMVQGGKGCLAIVDQGAENMRMRLENVQGGYILYPQLEILRTQNSSLGKNRKFFLYEKQPYSKNVRIRYAFLNNATYGDMANYYRNYLKQGGYFSGKAVSEALPFGMEIVNSLYMNKALVGIQYTTEEAATSFEKAQEMIAYFHDNGVQNIHVKLNGANENGLFVQQPGVFQTSTKAGGAKAYGALQEYCRTKGIPLYLNLNLPFYYADKAFNSYSRSKSTSRLINNKPITLMYKEKSTLADRTTLAPIEVVSPSYYTQYAHDYINNKAVIGSGISVGELSRILNSDFSEERHTPRAQTLKNVQKSLSLMQKEFALMGENPGMFALSYLGYGEKLPMTSAGYRIFEQDVPFVPMALHGYMDYTSSYWNNTVNAGMTRLKAIETGSGVSYRFADKVTKETMSSHNNFLYNVDYALWKEIALENYRYVNQALDGLNGVPITGHQALTDTLVKVTYENGQVLYINYGSAGVQADGRTIPAMGYIRVKG